LGAQIIDLMLLVIDINKGIQTQTAECLIIGEILTQKMIVVLNKVDLLQDKEKGMQKVGIQPHHDCCLLWCMFRSCMSNSFSPPSTSCSLFLCTRLCVLFDCSIVCSVLSFDFLKKAEKGLRGVFANTRFGKDVPMVYVSANPGSTDDLKVKEKENKDNNANDSQEKQTERHTNINAKRSVIENL
ncbi:GTP-binding protein, partial [Patescibacteria group bacterium]|nr:GTP-binding protein [Patescibacteria group bacterium]